MSPPVYELPIDRIDAAVAFIASHGGEPDVKQVRYQMSLIAGDIDDLAGVALACEVRDGCVDLFVSFDEQRGDLALARQLADKVLHKVNAHGHHRCRIVPLGPADVRAFWQQVNWLDLAFADAGSAGA